MSIVSARSLFLISQPILTPRIFLTCARAVCSRRTFVHRYFRERTHLLTQRSLQCLLDISRDPAFGSAARTLIVSRRTFEVDWDHYDGEGDITSWGTGYKEEKEFLKTSGLVTTYLTQVLQNARGCRTDVLDDQRKNPWGRSTFEKDAFERYFLPLDLDIEELIDQLDHPDLGTSLLWM